jgi:hypothetical protein
VVSAKASELAARALSHAPVLAGYNWVRGVVGSAVGTVRDIARETEDLVRQQRATAAAATPASATAAPAAGADATSVPAAAMPGDASLPPPPARSTPVPVPSAPPVDQSAMGSAPAAVSFQV